MRCFHTLTPSVIGAMLRQAKQRVLYSAPSLTDPVAAALVYAHQNLDEQCIVILDYSEALFRVGYGHNEPVTMLLEEGVPVRKQTDLRIGCVVVDDQGWVFTMPPMAVESQEEATNINAVEMASAQVNKVWAALASNASDDNTAVTAETPEIGNEHLLTDEVETVSEAIKKNPVQAFDIQRKVRVYQAHLQFVEIELEGGRIEQRTVRLPKEFKEALFTKDKEIEKRLNASYKLLDNAVSKEFGTLREEIKTLRDRYAPSLGGRLGRVLLLARKQEFNDQIESLKQRLQTYCQQALQSIQDTIEQSLESLASNLAPVVKKNPPEDLKARCSQITDEIAKEYLLDTLYKVAPSAKTLLANTKLNVTYKDVTLEMLEDKEFQQKVLAEFRYEPWTKPFADYSAARERK